MVVDALNQRTHEIYEISMIQPKSDLMSKIKIESVHNVEYMNLHNNLLNDEVKLNITEFKVDQNGLIWFKNKLYVPNVIEINLLILKRCINHLMQAILVIKK